MCCSHWSAGVARPARTCESGSRRSAEIDALSAMAAAKRDNPDWCMPELHTGRRVQGDALGHPLIDDRRRVSNDVEVGPPGTLLLVTGSNMSGKSTLLRAIGLNTVLAQAGGCVCARRAAFATLRSADQHPRPGFARTRPLVFHGRAGAAERRRRRGRTPARKTRVLLYLLDEILQGTNSAERSLAVRAVARHLLDAGAIGVMTTHDLSLAGEEPLKSSAVLVHFTEAVRRRGP